MHEAPGRVHRMARMLTTVLGLVGLAVLLVSAYLGYAYPSAEVLRETSSLYAIATLDPLSRAIMIFANNAMVAGELAAGALLLLPAYALLAINGYVTGTYLGHYSAVYPVGSMILALLPHGVFEVTAYIYVVAKASTLSIDLFTRRISLREAGETLIRVIGIALYLLLIAAFVESYISPLLLARH